MLPLISTCILLALSCLQVASAQRDFDKTDNDLERYISRPDLRPPKFSVKVLDEENVAPGYWFVSPYVDLVNRKPTRIYQTGQVGPHIYDNHGQLVWSGAGLFPARNVFDFKRSKLGSPTFLLGPHEHEKQHIGGAGVILNNTFEVRKYVQVPKGSRTVNMHEFNVLDNAKTALMFMHEVRLYESTEPDFHGWIVDLGFVELDIHSNKPIFEWWASDYVHPLESTVYMPDMPGSVGRAWDYFHINSVDKDKNGDYLISARHTNTIYKISGVDGSIIWRLGGKNSSFEQRGFNFSSQHDARFRTQSDKSTIISFLNNAADGWTHTAPCSSAMVVSLDTSSTPMTATLVHKFDRPDGRRTNLRGNVQILPNSNTFVSWSANSYISEFSENGRLVLDAQFASDRFATYRAYKFTFDGRPSVPPDLVCSAYGISAESATTVCHVSWNGATGVDSWRFFEVDENEADENGPGKVYLGTAQKSGFETAFLSNTFSATVFAEAIDVNGNRLAQTPFVMTKILTNHNNKLSDHHNLKTHTHRKPKQTAQAKTSLQDFKVILGDRIGDFPPLWPMVFCVMMGATGALLVVYSSRFFRTFRLRRIDQKGAIRVGDA